MDKKTEILAELATGKSPKYLANKYKTVGQVTITKWRNDLREGLVINEILDVAKKDPHVLQMVAEGVKDKVYNSAPIELSIPFGEKVDALVEGVTSLQLLDKAFHHTVTKLLKWADNRITDEMDIKEWKMIAGQIGELHTAIFAKGGTNVNVMQMNGESSNTKVSKFKAGYRR